MNKVASPKPSNSPAFLVCRGEKTADDGVLIVDKPTGVTSHDVVGAVRRLAATRKVGHAGTLDPEASGVLLLGVGKGTRLIHYLMGSDKTYQAVMRFGITTDTEDAQGTVLTANGVGAGLDKTEILANMAEFIGNIMQRPSSVSAIKVNGKRAYDLVRQGQNVKLAERPVTIYDFCLEQLEPVTEQSVADKLIKVQDITVIVRVSSGTYIRALARDIGEKIGCGAHLRAIRRTQVGNFPVESTSTIADLSQETADKGQLPVVKLADFVKEFFPSITVDAQLATAIGYGQTVSISPDISRRTIQENDILAVLTVDENSRKIILLALAKVVQSTDEQVVIKPQTVLVPTGI